jgi:hypothetical protein
MNALGERFKGNISTNAAYGMVLLVFLLGMILLGSMREQVMQARTNTQYAERELAKLNSINKTDVWAKRAKQSADVLQEWQNTSWQGETVGVLAATIQQSLIGIADELGLQNAQINVGNELINVGGATIMRYSLSGIFSDESKTMELLIAQAAGVNKLIVDEVMFDYYTAGRSQVRLSGLAVVRIASDTSEKDIEG